MFSTCNTIKAGRWEIPKFGQVGKDKTEVGERKRNEGLLLMKRAKDFVPSWESS